MINVEGFTAAIGPAGDVLYVPMRITGGRVTGIGHTKEIVGGTDFAQMYADEKLVHEGHLVAADPAGDIVICYNGTSQAVEGSYDEILEGRLPGHCACRLSIRSASTNPAWRPLNQQPLLGMGSFDGSSGTLDVMVISIAQDDARI